MEYVEKSVIKIDKTFLFKARNDLDLAELQDAEVDPIELAGAFEGDIILSSEEQRRLINDVREGGVKGRGERYKG